MPDNNKTTFSQPGKRLSVTLVLLCSSLAAVSHADEHDRSAKRIEVYALTQNIWEIQPGDTLSEITARLLPNNPAKWASLQQDIMLLNPEVFIDADPKKMIAGKVLRLPGYMKQADSKTDPKTTIVETYSWGNIKRQK
jgi:Tfp pilus assembly protein FimV